MLGAGRTAQGHSWANPFERIMSILNLSIHNVSLARNLCDATTEQIMKSANTMTEIRKIAEKVPALKEQWVGIACQKQQPCSKPTLVDLH
jgi:hypothetical protein